MRERNKLTALQVSRLAEPGRYNDGAGLYLLVKENSKSWVYRWRDRVSGKLRDKGLGPAWDVTLAEAREKAQECRAIVRAGGDPIAEARQQLAARRAKHVTFADCASRYIRIHRPGWRNAKHASQWENTLRTYAGAIADLPVAQVDTAAVLRCVEPHWTTKTETMTRVRQRIEAILDWATVRELRSGDNPARWQGHLDHLLPKKAKVQPVQHRPALAYADGPAFMNELRERMALSARCVELQVLTASRPGEVAEARWEEFDLDARTWTIPRERMKAEREHRIPLAGPAISLLRGLPKEGEHVFPGPKGKPLTTAAGLKMVKSLRPGITAHGFRSTFRDWAGETTAHPREVIEHALAHRLKDKAEAAYQRGDLYQRRIHLMADWAAYLDGVAAGVVPMRRAAT